MSGRCVLLPLAAVLAVLCVAVLGPVRTDAAVLDLSADDVDSLVGKDQFVLLEVFAPWCGHCRRLEPVYRKVAERFDGDRRVAIAKVDGDQYPEVARRFNVMGFPTILWFEPGNNEPAATYSGSRTEDDLVEFVRSRVAESAGSTGAGDSQSEQPASVVTRDELRGKVQTVLGLIQPEQLGPTHTHEHLRIAYQKFWSEPKNREWLQRAYEPITFENVHWVQTYWEHNKFNMELNDDALAVQEMKRFKAAGGSGIVELTTIGIRFPGHAASLRRISRESGVHVVLGTGYYMGPSHPEDVTLSSVDELADVMVQELLHGVDGTDIRAGVIGELGMSYPMYPNERKVLLAGARAQRATGAGLIIHPGRNETAPFEIVDLLRAEGADISRTVMSHLDRTIRDYDSLVRLAETGVMLEWDMFGLETSYYPPNPRTYMPNDAVRIDFIVRLVRAGYGKQIVVGHDVFSKHRLNKYGGHGYSHILENIVPRFRLQGLSEGQIDDLLVGNPRRLLTFA